MFAAQLKSLTELAALKPALSQICTFHAALYRLWQTSSPFVRLNLDPTEASTRQQQGFPLISGVMLKIDPAKASRFFADLLALLAAHGQQGQDEIARLQKSLEQGQLELTPLLVAALDRDRRPISEKAAELEVQAALLEYGLNLSLAGALRRCRAENQPSAVANWHQGYCPFCGGLPSIAAHGGEDGKKTLHCSLCGYDWQFQRITCIHCGNTDHETLAYFTAEGEPGYRVDICRKCCGYLKVLDNRQLQAGLQLDIADIASLPLDFMAAQEGFSRGKKDQPGQGKGH